MKEKLTSLQKKNNKEWEARKKREIITAVWNNVVSDEDEVMKGFSVRKIFDPLTMELDEDNKITCVVGEDGHIHFSDDYAENWTYFYPEQIDILQKLVTRAKKQIKLLKG